MAGEDQSAKGHVTFALAIVKASAISDRTYSSRIGATVQVHVRRRRQGAES